MLVLTRRVGESVKIGSDIRITVMVINEKKIIARVLDPLHHFNERKKAN